MFFIASQRTRSLEETRPNNKEGANQYQMHLSIEVVYQFYFTQKDLLKDALIRMSNQKIGLITNTQL
jgi:hypothetical protein